MWWLKYLKRKRSPEHDLTTLVDSLKQSLGAHLVNTTLFGSLASGEFQEAHSDVNVLIVLDDLNMVTLGLLRPAVQTWLKKGHIAPVLMEQADVPRAANAFPIEFLDMQDHHRVLWGKDVLTGFQVDPARLLAQCEHDLALNLLKLRQAIILKGGKPEALREVLIHSLPSFLTLFRTFLRLTDGAPKLTKMEAAERLAAKLGFDATCLLQIHDLHLQRRTDNLADLAENYLIVIEKVRQSLTSAA